MSVSIERGLSDLRPVRLGVTMAGGTRHIAMTLDDVRQLAGLLDTFDLTSSAASQLYIETGELLRREDILPGADDTLPASWRVELEVPVERLRDTLADAHAGVAHWARLAVADWGVNVHDLHDGGPAIAVTWGKLVHALSIMAGGHYVAHDGTSPDLARYHVAGARTILDGDPDGVGDYDADTWDIALQLAALGELVYG